jgi:serine/threonine protein kinase
MRAAPVDHRYSLDELLASGGTADVFLGRDRKLDRRVAIKRLRGTVDPTARASFDREARLLAGFSHPNAVAVYDAVEDESGPLIVMEYVEGTTLRAHLGRVGRLPVEDAVAIADQLLSALAAAHARGIVHRDIKPGNVLVSTDGHVKLADFGIATMADSTGRSASGEVLGTPKYLSPEQVSGRRATPQSDLYAVGVLCYEMVCGHVPFAGESAAATMAAHQRSPVPPLRASCPFAPDWYIVVVERALAKSPAERYPDAQTMRHALRAGLGGESPGAVSTISLPITVAAADASGVERGGTWALVLFAILGVLVALGVWALGAQEPAGVVPEPTTAVPLTEVTTPAPTLPPTAVPGGR